MNFRMGALLRLKPKLRMSDNDESDLPLEKEGFQLSQTSVYSVFKPWMTFDTLRHQALLFPTSQMRKCAATPRKLLHLLKLSDG